MKKLTALFFILTLNCYAQPSSCTHFTGVFRSYGGGFQNASAYATLNAAGLCYNGLIQDSTYYFQYRYPHSGFFEIEVALYNCASCSNLTYLLTDQSSCSESGASGCANVVQYDYACNVWVTNAIGGGNCFTPDSLYVISITIPHGCTGASICPMIKCGGCVPLPIKLISFAGDFENGNVILSWLTGVEINNDYFTIEKLENEDWVEIGHMKGGGNLDRPTQYSFNAGSQTENVAYYRLKQTDYNGASTYSNPISLSIDLKNYTVTYLDLLGQPIKQPVLGSFEKRIYTDGTFKVKRH